TPEQQARDSSECQTWAKQQSGWDPTTDTAKGVGVGAAVGALGGAALGAAVGAAAGSPGTGAAIGAAAGGLGGATFEGLTAEQRFKAAFQTCMRERGHNVVLD